MDSIGELKGELAEDMISHQQNLKISSNVENETAINWDPGLEYETIEKQRIGHEKEKLHEIIENDPDNCLNGNMMLHKQIHRLSTDVKNKTSILLDPYLENEIIGMKIAQNEKEKLIHSTFVNYWIFWAMVFM
jgi:hypothetical protein